MIDVALLRSSRSPLLQGLADVHLAVLADVLIEERFAADEVVILQGDAGHDLYVLVEGQVRLTRHEHDLGVLSPGAHFGEIALIGHRGRAATVVAVGDVVAWRLSEEAWRQLTTQQPRTAVAVLERLVDRLADQLVAMTDHVELLFDRPTVARERAHAVTIVEGSRTRHLTVRSGTRLGELLPPAVDGADVTAAMLGQRPVGLSTPVLSPARIEALTLSSWEGREVWRRSAGLLFLAAARQVAPTSRFTLLHSVGAGRVVRGAVSSSTLSAIGSAMRELALADRPFVREQWTLEDARAHFAAVGDDDAVAALGIARGPTMAVTGLAGVYVQAMGPLLPTTGALTEVTLRPHPEGALVVHGPALGRFLDEADVDAALAHEARWPRFASPMQQDHERWLRGMGVTSIGSFNAFCVSGRVTEIVRNAEGFHEKHIGRIADTIAARGDGVRVIAVAGPSSSGKTTFIKRLTVQLEVNGVRPVGLSLDDYYVDRERTPKDERGEYDYEVLGALDTDLLQQHLRALLAGDEVKTAHFDFKRGVSSKDGGPRMRLRPGEVLLIEGIHGLNPALVGDAVTTSQMFRIFVQPALCLPFDPLTAVNPSDLRFIRRIVRDRHGRGTKAADNILRWSSVRRGEARHIFPHQHHADVVFDTSLAYELGVLKVYGERYLLEVPPDHPAAPTAYRLRGLLDRVVAIYPDHVPPTSILREFIGGSGFEY